MPNPFREMNCYVLAGGQRQRSRHFQPEGDLTRLERSYRRYATVFEKVSIVIKKEQAREKYLNFPHVCDKAADYDIAYGVEAALKNADSKAVFIGSCDITDFPLSLAVDLVKQYNGEKFLGYYDASHKAESHQPLFGIYSKSLVPKIEEMIKRGETDLSGLMAEEGTLLPLPEDIPAASINLP